MYYSDKLRLVKGNLTTTWKIINELIGKKIKSQVNSISENNQKITNPKDIASAFNSYFVNAGPNLARKINCKDKKKIFWFSALTIRHISLFYAYWHTWNY